MLKTTLHHYRFDLSQTDDAARYAELRRNVLEKIGFEVWQMNADFDFCKARKTVTDFMENIRAAAGPIELDTEYLFHNQWNASGLRVFNWAEMIYRNKKIKEGYWIDQTAEMRDILHNTHKCGYCGHMEAAQKGAVFCTECLASEYLKIDDLHLTRMRPISDDSRTPGLTDAERAYLIPLYREAQQSGNDGRAKAHRAKRIADENTNCDKTIIAARTKRDVALWLLNAPLPLSIEANAIFYQHTNRVCFGWRTPLTDDELSLLLDVVSEFPWSYDIKRQNGSILSGER